MKYTELLATMTACPFCDLHHRQVILENETAFLTFSIAPYHSDHLLVCPKRHVEHFLDLTSAEFNDIGNLQKQGLEILRKLGHDNVTFLVREGNGSGKSINHIHYHLIPEITLGNADHTGAERPVLDEAAIADLVARIKSVI
jgi:diadenosine tetraphosphate (Ap4A) HIT family hydrolase